MGSVEQSSACADLHGAGEEAKVHMSFLSKLEAMASSSVRVAEKCSAKLIVVFTDTGLTAALVAKYRCACCPHSCLWPCLVGPCREDAVLCVPGSMCCCCYLSHNRRGEIEQKPLKKEQGSSVKAYAFT